MGSLRKVDAANCRAVNCGTSVHLRSGGVMLRESFPSNIFGALISERVNASNTSTTRCTITDLSQLAISSLLAMTGLLWCNSNGR